MFSYGKGQWEFAYVSLWISNLRNENLPICNDKRFVLFSDYCLTTWLYNPLFNTAKA
jgi:hypothetical protein